jgi:F-type H+-transporting ATPase subunit gamma
VATLQDIRRRITSVHNTRKITKAMEMVSAAKLRRAQIRIEALRPYANGMVDMMHDLATFADQKNAYALLRENDGAKCEALLVITGDRGLAGAFNANVLRAYFESERRLRASDVSTAASPALALEVRPQHVGVEGAGCARAM